MSFSGLVTLGVLTHHLGPVRFGVIALYRTVLTIVDQYASFNTWQTIIKYGTEQIAANKPNELKRLIKLAFVIDITTSCIGCLVVVGLAFVVPHRFGWTHQEAMLCAIYAITLISKVSGTSDGIYRIFDAYRVQAIIGSIGSAVMTLTVVIAVLLGAGFVGCVLALIFGEVASNLAGTFASFWVAHRAGFGGWFRMKLGGIRRDHPGLFRFLVSTNAQTTLKTSQAELDMVVVGAMLGKAEAGLYRVVKQLGTIPGRVFMSFEQVLYTELARFAAAKDYRSFRSLLRRSTAVALALSTLIWVAVAIGAPVIVDAVAGSAFAEAVDPVRWYLLAMVLQIAAAPNMRAMIALGRPGTLLLFDSGGLVIMLAAVVVGGLELGLVGVALAILVHRGLQLAWSSTWVLRHVRGLEKERELQLAAGAR
ncbi:MAG TPA: oligosaccharide flippase family protein [Kofleriaceae bacterium]